MKLPGLKNLPKHEVSIVNIKGINRNIIAGSNELIECENISLAQYPVLTSRANRELKYSDIVNPTAIFYSKNLYYIANGGFYVNGTLKFSGLSNSTKSIVVFHNKICIFPDKKYFDENDNTNGNIGNGAAYPTSGSCPDIDFVCVHDNRVFGVKGSTIYACALGNIQDWTTFVDAEGNPSDSGAYAVDVASPGPFKGIYEYQNHVVCFKEHNHHELYGQLPSNFRVIDVSKTGCLDNKSIVEVSSILYFLNTQGIFQYGGGQSVNISLKLNEKYVSGKACTNGRLYYISLYNGTAYNLYVYDTVTNLWWREDNIAAIDFARNGNDVYCLTIDGKIYKFFNGNDDFKWSITISDLSEISKKIKSNVNIAISLYAKENTEITVSISEDRKPFVEVLTYATEDSVTTVLPLSIRAISEFKLKISGNGYVEIYNIEKSVVGGGSK